MTTIQLAQRLTRYLKVKSLADTPLPVVVEIQEAMNMGLTTFQSLISESRKQKPVTWVAEEPKIVTVDLTDGSKSIEVSTAFPIGIYQSADDLTGRGLIIGSSAFRLNRFMSGTEMVDPHLGVSGTQAATILCDGIALTSQDRQMASDITIQPAGGGQLKKLVRSDSVLSTIDAHLQLGQPEAYSIEYIGGSESSEASWMLRLWPLPNSRFLLKAHVSRFPAAVELCDLTQTPRHLPVDTLEEGDLVRLCAVNLLSCSLFDLEKFSTKTVQIDAQQAEIAMAKRMSPNPSGDAPFVGTPPGF